MGDLLYCSSSVEECSGNQRERLFEHGNMVALCMSDVLDRDAAQQMNASMERLPDPCHKVYRNVRASARNENQMEWFEATYKDAKAWKQVRMQWLKMNGRHVLHMETCSNDVNSQGFVFT